MSTVESSNERRTRLDPSNAPAYIRKAIVSSLNRYGFEGAEAGALAEVERLLEHRMYLSLQLPQRFKLMPVKMYRGYSSPHQGSPSWRTDMNQMRSTCSKRMKKRGGSSHCGERLSGNGHVRPLATPSAIRCPADSPSSHREHCEGTTRTCSSNNTRQAAAARERQRGGHQAVVVRVGFCNHGEEGTCTGVRI